MGKLILFLHFVFLTVYGQSQDSLAKPVAVISGNFNDFNVDQNGNIYLLVNQQLKKVSPSGDSLAVYNDTRRFGKLTSTDVSNPLKIVLFYKGSGTVVLLDRFLAVLTTIDLRKIKIASASAVRLAYDNNLWVFDEVESKLKKINDAGKVLFESSDTRQLFGAAPSFPTIIDDNKTLYLYDTAAGWYLFDYYGGFIKKEAFTHWSNAQVVNGTMAGTQQQFLVSSKGNDFDFKKQPLFFPAAFSNRVIFTGKRTYALFADGIKIYDAP